MNTQQTRRIVSARAVAVVALTLTVAGMSQLFSGRPELYAQRPANGRVDKLIQDLKSEDLNTRAQAARELATVGDARALEPLFACLKEAYGGSNGSGLVYHAEQAIKSIKDPRAIDTLIKYLQGDNYGLVSAAAASLGKFEETKAVDALFAVRKRGKEKGSGMPIKLLWTIENVIRDNVGGSRARETFLKLLKEDDPLAAAALKRFPGPEVVDALIDTVEHAKGLVRLEAMRSLGQIKDPRAVPALIALLNDSDPSLRSTAIAQLGTIADRRAVAPLVERLKQESVDNVIERIAEALGDIGDPAAIAALNEVRSRNQNNYVRKEIDNALAKLQKVQRTQPAAATVTSNPANGASDVNPMTKVITISFPADMNMENYTVVPAEDGHFPEPIGAEPYEFRDARTFVMNVRLSANTPYAFGLNSARRQGFKTVDGKPLPPTIIRFKTGVAEVRTGTQPEPHATNDLFVSKEPRGLRAQEFRTINEAIKNARPGAKIHVYPGTYAEGLVIDKPVTMSPAEGERGQVVIEFGDASCIQMKTDRAIVKGFAIRGKAAAQRKKFFAVDISQGELTLEDCDITSDSLSCIAVHGDSTNPIVRRCKIHDGELGGVYAFENAKGTFDDCEIFGTKLSGIEISGGANPTFKHCKIHSSRQGGVYSLEKGQGLLIDCDIYDNALAGVQIRTGASTVVRNCKIHDGKQPGAFINDSGEGTFEDCEIYGNNMSAIEIARSGKPVVRRCTMRDNKGGGVYAHDKAEGTIEDCDIFNSGWVGVGVATGSTPTFRRCTIRDCKSAGIVDWEGGGGTFEDCIISGNALAGIETKSAGNPIVRNCKFRDGKQSGVFANEKGLGTFEGCEITGNTLAGVQINADANPIFRRCIIRDNKGEGVVARPQARGTIEDCDISGNLKQVVEMPGADLTLRGNRINEGAIPPGSRGNGSAATDAKKALAARIEALGGQVRFEGDKANPQVAVDLRGIDRVNDDVLKEIAALRGLDSLELAGTSITDTGLSYLKDARTLSILGLARTKITDRGLANLSGITGLRVLDLEDTKIGNEGLANLKNMDRLRGLDLNGTQVGDAGMESLKGLASLKLLHLNGTNVGDAGLAKLAELTRLENLSLTGAAVTDAGLRALKGMTHLKKLDLSFTKVTDAGLKQLAGLKDLEHLSLVETPVTDAGLANLHSLPNLKKVDLNLTHVTETGIHDLKIHLRGVQVIFNPPVERGAGLHSSGNPGHAPQRDQPPNILPVGADQGSLQSLLRDLKDPDAVVRLRAIKAIAKMGPAARDAVAALREISRGDPDEDVRLIAANAVSRISATSNGGRNGTPLSRQQSPSKEQAIELLKQFLAALENRDYDKAVGYLKLPASIDREKVKKGLEEFIPRQEISRAGIDMLAARGKWGPLAEIIKPERARSIAERAGASIDTCFGFALEDAEAFFFWDGRQFQILRCNDIGKLTGEQRERPRSNGGPAPTYQPPANNPQRTGRTTTPTRGGVRRVVYDNPIAGFSIEIPEDWEMATGGLGNIEIAIDAGTGARLWGQPALWFCYAGQQPEQEAQVLANALKLLNANNVTVRRSSRDEWQVACTFEVPILGRLICSWSCRSERGMSYVIGFGVRSALLDQFRDDIDVALRTCRLIDHPIVHVFHEPTERAYRLVMPEGWRWEGAIIRTLEVPGFFTWKASSPDGTVACLTGPPAVNNMFKDYAPADQQARGIVLEGMRKQIPDAQLENVTIMSRAAEHARRGLRMLGLNSRLDRVRADYAGTVNGVRVRARIDITTWMPTPSNFPDPRLQGRGNWFVVASGAWAPVGRFDELYPVARGVQASMRVSPDWIKLQHKTIRDVLAERHSAMDEAFKGWDAYIRDMERIRDPQTGEMQEVPNRDGTIWRDLQGNLHRVPRNDRIEQAVRNRGWTWVR